MLHINLICKSILIFAVATLAVGSIPAQAANDYFLKFDGVDGESTDRDHRGWVEIETFNWGVSSYSDGRGQSIPQFRDFSWTQVVDKSVTSLFSAISSGKIYPSVIFEISTTFAGGSGSVPYFRMRFKNAPLTSLDLSGSNGTRPMLAGAFAYQRIDMDYWAFDDTGRQTGHQSASFDLSSTKGDIGALSMLFASGMSGPGIAVPVPEPETWALLLVGLGLVGVIARRRLHVA